MLLEDEVGGEDGFFESQKNWMGRSLFWSDKKEERGMGWIGVLGLGTDDVENVESKEDMRKRKKEK